MTKDIEITEFMIRAGVKALEDNIGVISDSGVVQAVYTSMHDLVSRDEKVIHGIQEEEKYQGDKEI